MRISDPLFDAESAGSTSGDYLDVSVWRDGRLLHDHLEVVDFGFDWDADRQIQGQASFAFADPEGKLAAYGLDDALAPFGSRLLVTWVSGSTGKRVGLGWWRIRVSDPNETWSFVKTPRGEELIVHAGGTVIVDADEETSTIVKERLDAESVSEAATSLTEVTRLLQNICAVTVHPDVVDRAAPKGLVYDSTPEGSRLNAVEDHLDRVFATYRMGPDGSFEVIPAAGVPIDFDITVGPRDGILTAIRRTLNDEKLYNGATSTSTTADGRQLVGRDVIEYGPLRWGGPFGRVPIFHNSPATSQEGIESDARTLLRNRQDRLQPIPVQVVTHPGVQLHDIVTLHLPTVAGRFEVDARVSKMSLRSVEGTPAKSMALGLVIPADFLEIVAQKVRGHVSGS